MAGSYNKVILIGNLGRDPETRTTPTGDNVASFSLATSERRQNQPEVTTWFNVSAWGQLADIASQYLHKGSYVYVEGALTQREYTTREGQTRQSLDVRARELRMLDKRGDTAGGEQGDGSGQQSQGQGVRDAWTQPQPQPSAPAADMDEIPF